MILRWETGPLAYDAHYSRHFGLGDSRSVLSQKHDGLRPNSIIIEAGELHKLLTDENMRQWAMEKLLPSMRHDA